jgi:hypothetical protein
MPLGAALMPVAINDQRDYLKRTRNSARVPLTGFKTL